MKRKPSKIFSIRRRKIIQNGLLYSTSFFLQFNWLYLNHSVALLPKKNQKMYDWILLYWMPYDNNLSSFGFPIIKMLTKGVQDDNILVVVESDFSDAKQLSRSIITKGNVNVQQLNAANSASEEVFAEYLSWAQSQFTAKKWAIIFLGHGGHLDEISPDENPKPGFDASTEWMNIKKLSDIISKFNQKIDARLELVFFQNCNKGTIETHYTFRDAAKYTLSSQLNLGAPNYYYEKLLQLLGKQPEINGGQLAEKIMEFERDDMYYSYTVTNNRYVRDLPGALNPLIDAILATSNKKLDKNKLNIYNYFDEQFVDAISLFTTLSKSSEITQYKCQQFIDFFKVSMIYKIQDNGNLYSRSNKPKNLSGLGILLPKSWQHLERYRYLPVFSDLKLVELFDAILFS